MVKLKPCPFCGSGDVKTQHDLCGRYHSAYIQCQCCKIRTAFYKGLRREKFNTLAAEAAEAWNRRADKALDQAGEPVRAKKAGRA